MSDIRYAIENSQFPLRHFDAWVAISRGLGHFWSSFSDDVMDVVRAMYAKSGWSGVRGLVETLAPLSGWGPSFSAMGGVMPPTCVDHVHVTSTGRLEISVDIEGAAHISVYRLVGDARVCVATYTMPIGGNSVATYTMPIEDWQALGGAGSPVCQRHTDAVAEALHEGHR